MKYTSVLAAAFALAAVTSAAPASTTTTTTTTTTTCPYREKTPSTTDVTFRQAAVVTSGRSTTTTTKKHTTTTKKPVKKTTTTTRSKTTTTTRRPAATTTSRRTTTSPKASGSIIDPVTDAFSTRSLATTIDPDSVGFVTSTSMRVPSTTARTSTTTTKASTSVALTTSTSRAVLSTTSTRAPSSTTSASRSTTLSATRTTGPATTFASSSATTRAASSTSARGSTTSTRASTSSTTGAASSSTTVASSSTTTRAVGPVVDVATSSTSKSTACTPSQTASVGKRGLNYNNATLTNLFSSTMCPPNSSAISHTSWAYNWFSAPGSDFNPYLEYVPMLWSNQSYLESIWDGNVAAAGAKGWKNLLGFNEPDLCCCGGSCMSIASAVSSWNTYMQPYASQGFRLGSPAVTNAVTANMGNDWLAQFLDQTPGKGGCIGCTIDFLTVHWYGDATDFNGFFGHVWYAWETMGNKSLPIWVTEFGVNGGTDEQVENFISVAINVFETNPAWSFVERYAWFTAAPTSSTSGPLVASNGSALSIFGQIYENQA